MVAKVAHLPELRFALGEPGLDTTSVDNAALALEKKGFYLRKIGKDGFRFGFQPTLKKVVGDRRASLDESEVNRALKKVVKEEWERGAMIPLVWFPEDDIAVPDQPRLNIVVVTPEKGLDDELRKILSEWIENRGGSRRSYPASIVWTATRQGRDLHDKLELFLCWKRVNEEISSGLLGDFETAERRAAKEELLNAEDDAREEVWASYQFALLFDSSQKDGLKLIMLGAGHASAGDSLSARVIAAMRSEGLLNESVGAGYLQRNWPTALKDSGVWPLSGLRQSFLDGSLTRLLDPERVLTEQIIRFVDAGEFGLGVGRRPDGTFENLWFKEKIRPEEVSFDAQTFLVLKEKAQTSVIPPAIEPQIEVKPTEGVLPVAEIPVEGLSRLMASGAVPPELWNKLGTRLIPKLRSGKVVSLQVQTSIEIPASERQHLATEIRRILAELGLERDWTIQDQ